MPFNIRFTANQHLFLTQSLIGLLILVKLWLVSGQPMFALADNICDDQLFVKLAGYLIDSQWLGPYGTLTLVKGPFYPMWIALTFLAGVPLLLSQHLLYAAACVVIYHALRSLVENYLLRTVIFAFLLFNPATFTWQLTRVLRDGLYPSLTLLVVGSAIGLFAQRKGSLLSLAGWASTCGLATAAFWLTREEGIWILPFLFFLIGWTLASLALSSEQQRGWRMLIVTLPLALPLLAIHAVSMANLAHYGVYAVVDSKTPASQAVYGALTRVRHTESKSQVPVPKETRSRIYQESKAFADLQPFFERNTFWTFKTVGLINHPSGPDEIGGGWFMWALRDAAAEAGYFKSSPQVTAFFQRIADEVNTACEEKRLDCLSQRKSLLPSWRFEYLVPIVRQSVMGFSQLATFSEITTDLVPSTGSPDHLRLFRDLTREQPSGQETSVRGWVVHTDGQKLTAALVESDVGRVVSSAGFSSSLDVYEHFLRMKQKIASAKEARFEVYGRCTHSCVLRISDKHGILADIPLEQQLKPQFNDPLWIHLDAVSISEALPRQTDLDHWKLSLLGEIAAAYQRITPFFVAVAFVAMGIWLFQTFSNRKLTIPGLIAACIMMTLWARLLMLAIIDIMLFKAVNVIYMSPIYPLLLLSCSLFIADLQPDFLCRIGTLSLDWIKRKIPSLAILKRTAS